MALTTYDYAAMTGTQGDFRVRIEVLMNSTYAAGNWHWCDINSQWPGTPLTGFDELSGRLVSMPTIGITGELVPGRFTYSVSRVVLDDDDHKFGMPCDADNPIYKLCDNPQVVCKLTSWHGALVRIRVAERLTVATSDTYHPLGIYRVKAIGRSGQKSKVDGREIYTAQMDMVPCSYALQQTSAREVRRGDTWLTNSPLPSIVRELVERGSNSDYTIASDMPSAITTTGTTRMELSTLGNMPVLDDNGNWNESRGFVPRYQFRYGDGHYFVGYSVADNLPAVSLWDTVNNTWLTRSFGSGTYEGWTGAFGVVYDNMIYVFCVSNQSAWGSGYTTNYRNIAHVLFSTKYDLTGAPVSWANMAPLWRMGMAATRPAYFGSHWYYGKFTGSWDKTHVPVPFPANVSSPGLEQSAYDPEWHSIQDDAGTWAPSWRDEVYEALDSADTHNDGFGYVHNSGYAAGWTTAYGADGSDWPVLSYLHASLHDSYRYSASRERIYWFAHNGADWYLQSFDLATATGIQQRVRFGISDGTSDSFWSTVISAFEVYTVGATNKLWIAGQAVDTTSTTPHNPVSMRLWYLASFASTGALSGFAAMHSDFSDVAYSLSRKWAPVLVSIRASSSGAAISGCACNVYSAGGHCYGVWYWASSSLNGCMTAAGGKNTHTSTLPFEISNAHTSDAKHWIIDQSTGVVWEYGVAGILLSGNINPTANGDPIDSENTWSSCNLLALSDGSAAYGVSASGPPADTQERIAAVVTWAGDVPQLGAATPQGRISLFSMGYSISDVVRLSDFEGASCWDALEMCRAWAGDYTMGFDADSTTEARPRPMVYFRARSVATPSITIVQAAQGINRNDMTVVTCDRIETRLDDSLVANKITVPTYVGEVAAPEVSIVLSGGDDRPMPGDAYVTQTKPAAQRILLRCLRDGAARTGSYSGPRFPLLFSWSRTMDELVTSLKADALSTATTIYVRGLYSDQSGTARLGASVVAVGDECLVAGGAVVQILTVSPGTSRLVLSGAIGTGATARTGTTVTILPKQAGRYSDSRLGICSTRATFTLPTSATLADLVVDDTSNLAPGILLYRDTAYVRVVAVVDSTTARVEGLILGSGQGRDATWPSNTNLSGAVYVESAGTAYPIGNTGASISVSAPPADTAAPKRSGAGRVARKLEREWRAGDAIIVTCKGLSAKRDDNTVLHAEDSASVERYGQREWKPVVENRLMTPQRARLLIEGLPEMAVAPYITTCSGCPFIPGVEVGDTFYVQDTHLWPSEDAYLGIDTYNRVAHSVTAILHNLQARKTTLTLRSYVIGGRSAEGGAGDADRIPAQAVPAGDRRRS